MPEKEHIINSTIQDLKDRYNDPEEALQRSLVQLLRENINYIVVAVVGIVVTISTNEIVEFGDLAGLFLASGSAIIMAITLWLWRNDKKQIENLKDRYVDDMKKLSCNFTDAVDTLNDDFQQVLHKKLDSFEERLKLTVDAYKRENLQLMKMIIDEKHKIKTFYKVGEKIDE